MSNNNTNNIILKRGRGRPPSSSKKRTYNEEKVKPGESQNVECINCFHVFDLNSNYRSLEQAIMNDTKFCPDCWKNEIMQKEYADQNDIVQEFYRSIVGMRRW